MGESMTSRCFLGEVETCFSVRWHNHQLRTLSCCLDVNKQYDDPTLASPRCLRAVHTLKMQLPNGASRSQILDRLAPLSQPRLFS